MRHYRNYTTEKVVRTTLIFILAALVVLTGYEIGIARADKPLKCWILCQPESRVYIRRTPEKTGIIDGWLEVGDEFLTDGKTANGFIHAVGVGNGYDAWIYTGNVVTEKPEEINGNYYCVAKVQAACRRWVDGPQIRNAPWLKNNSEVKVYWMTSEWAVTSRGYIQSTWLEEAT